MCIRDRSQAFPSKPIRIIVSTSPGGITDLLARNSGQAVSESIGQPVLVEYRPGAGTFIGMSACAKSPPDGYTVCITTAESLVYNPLLFTKLPYDPDHDFAPVTVIAQAYGLIVAHEAVKAGTFPELLALARANPGTLNFATWGPGSIPGIYLEWINRQNGVQLTAIPYKGAGAATPAILAGQVQVTYTAIGLVRPHLKSGRLKLLAVTGSKRQAEFPDTPSLGELNSDPALYSGFSLFAPSKTPAPIVERLSAEFAKAIRSPRMQALLKENSLEGVGYTPSEFAEFLKADRANAARIFRTLGIKPADAPAI